MYVLFNLWLLHTVFYSFTHGHIISFVIMFSSIKHLDGSLCVDSLLVVTDRAGFVTSGGSSDMLLGTR